MTPNKFRFKDRDLGRRLEKFAEDSLALARKIPRNDVTRPIITQFVKASTSPGANYQEACEAESAKDFVHKMKLARKELKEAHYWLRLLHRICEELRKEITRLGKESTELIKIITSIISKFPKN